MASPQQARQPGESKTPPVGGGTGVWRHEGRELTVEYPLALLREMQEEIQRAMERAAGRGTEIAGVLVGSRLGGFVRLHSWRQIAREHSPGPALHLEPRDEAGLVCLLEGLKYELAGTEHQVVGWFVSRTRGAAMPTPEERRLHEHFFSNSGQFLLVFRPTRSGENRGVFYVQTGGAFEVMEPPMDLPKLTARAVGILQNRAPDSAAQSVDVPLSENEVSQPDPAEPRAEMGAWLSPAVRFSLVGLATVALAFILSPDLRMLIVRRMLPPPQAPRSLVSMHAGRSSDRVDLNWDGDTSALASARGATLEVFGKGTRTSRERLSAAQLRLGHWHVLNEPGEMSIRLTVEPKTGPARTEVVVLPAAGSAGL